MSYAALEPSLALLSTLASFPFAIFCARFMGAAAFRVTRDERHAIVAVAVNAKWAGLLFTFVVASTVASGAVALIDEWSSLPAPSAALSTKPLNVGADTAGHGVFAAVLVGSLWPYATSLTSRILLLAYLAAILAALVTRGAEAPLFVLVSYAVGWGAARATASLLRAQS